MSKASNTDETTPKKDEHPLPLSLLSLPDEIVLSCLARVPRNCYLNLSMVSKTLRSLVRSSEFNRLLSLLHKKPLYIFLYEGGDAWTYHWLTLSSIEKTTRTIGYQLVPIPFPSPSFVYGYSTVTVGSEIYFVYRSFKYPSDLWILDTRSGKFTQGPSMKVWLECEIVGVINGKIHVIGVVGYEGPNEKIQVEVFDPKSKIWKSVGQEKVPPKPWSHQYIAPLEGKIYMVECGRISVYNPREGEGKRMVYIVSERLIEYKEGIRKESLREIVRGACVVENVLYAWHDGFGLMWFDTKLNVWRRLVCDREEICEIMYGYELLEMVEYEGKLAVFNMEIDNDAEMFLIALHRVGENIFWKVEWSGIVTTFPYRSCLLNCFVVSN